MMDKGKIKKLPKQVEVLSLEKTNMLQQHQ
jgi:hypothetical protein